MLILKFNRYLVYHGARIDKKDRFGNTPIDEAKNNNFMNIKKFLEARMH